MNNKQASDWYASKIDAPSLPCRACGHSDEARQVEFRGKMYWTHNGRVYSDMHYLPYEDLAVASDGSIFDTDGDS